MYDLALEDLAHLTLEGLGLTSRQALFTRRDQTSAQRANGIKAQPVRLIEGNIHQRINEL